MIRPLSDSLGVIIWLGFCPPIHHFTKFIVIQMKKISNNVEEHISNNVEEHL